MDRLLELLGVFVGGGVVTFFIESILSRRLRHNRDLRAYRKTVNMLMDDYAKLIVERTHLLRELSDAGISPEELQEMTDDEEIIDQTDET